MAVDLARVVNRLRTQARQQQALWDYYRGRQPLLYVSENVRDYFRERGRSRLMFVENWVSVIVEAVLERIRLVSVGATDDAAQGVIDAVWGASGFPLLAQGVHEQALATGVAYVIVWPNRDDVPQVYYQRPGLMAGVPDSEDATRLAQAAKWWMDNEGYARLTVYTPEALYRYRTRRRLADGETVRDLSPQSLEAMGEPEPNPLGVLPVVMFRPRLDGARAEFETAAPVQDMLNKTIADMMVTGEWGAFPQRWIVTQADLTALKSNPAGLWQIPAALASESEPTKVGQFEPADLVNYTRVVEHFVNAIAAIARVPSYYLRTSGDVPSGEALRLLDNVLAHRARSRVDAFAVSWREVFSLALRFAGKDVPPHEISVEFAPTEVAFPARVADARAKNRQAGMPLSAILREEGKSEAFIAMVEQEQEAERAAEALPGPDALARVLSAMDGTGEGDA